ncbi:MAG: TolC family protein [Ferruginibacter sp.]
MEFKKAFIYTSTVFALIVLLSYIANAQARPLSLKEALALTLTNNRDIKISNLELSRSEQQTRVAKAASLPSAGVSAQIAHYFNEAPFFGFSSSGASAPGDKIPYGRLGGRDQAAATAWISQPLYNAATRPGIINAQLQERQSQLAVQYAETDIAALLKQTYIQILVLHERIRLQQESIQRNEKALQDARSLLAQGRALRVDTLRAYTSVKNLEPDLLKLSNAMEVGKQQLRTLAGLDSAQEIVLTDSLILPETAPVLSEEEVYSEARSHRADLLSLDLQQQQADQQIKIAAAGMKPSVSLTAQYLIQTQASQFNYFNAYYPSTPFVGALVSVPIFNGNSNKAKVKQAQIAKDQTVLRSTQAYEELRTAVKQAVANVRETAARIQTSANVQQTAKLSYEITQYRYARAVASRLELTDAELALTAAQSNYLEAVYDYLSARIEVERTAGMADE